MSVEIQNPVKIDRLILRPDGKTVELYSGPLRGHVLKLFNAAELVTVGINPADLTPGQVTPCLFLAHWQLSKKLNQRRNPHRDLTRLESLLPTTPPTASDHETAALLRQVIAGLAELRQMMIAAGHTPPAESAFDYFYADGDIATIPEEKTAFNDFRRTNAEKVPASRDALRRWVRERKASPPAGKPATPTATRTPGKLQPGIEYHRKGRETVIINN